MIIIKLILLITFGAIFWQDKKERLVHWFLFPIIAFCSGILIHKNMIQELFFLTLIINLLFVTSLILVIYFYSKFKLKTSIINTFGLGDALLFIALSFTFSSVSFLVLFVFGLIFSLITHLALKPKIKQETVPLAGYLSLFFGLTYLSHWIGILPTLYTF
ncbi:hypothetical protein [Olleya sp. Bg11-27]|uniref:hypothetical protein n=1 Tax=Olleya sp. Bg11-27 TaxID=2058135 RepID=UPI000C3188CD|nr:hypothetical protein [Olleya sp. Bg11-27]AUC77570.1 hypothetical protein CW732_18550 [Olleya sp. Bg11-27]